MKLYTNVGSTNYGEYFVVNKTELRENYRAEKEAAPEYFPYKSFDDYLENAGWNELIFVQDVPEHVYNTKAKIYQTYKYPTNVRNIHVIAEVVIDSNRNIIDYSEEIA